MVEMMKATIEKFHIHGLISLCDSISDSHSNKRIDMHLYLSQSDQRFSVVPSY